MVTRVGFFCWSLFGLASLGGSVGLLVEQLEVVGHNLR